jgi:hypothetical protein
MAGGQPPDEWVMQLRAGLAGLVATVWSIAAILVFTAAGGSSAAPVCPPGGNSPAAKLASADDGPRSDTVTTSNDPRCGGSER